MLICQLCQRRNQTVAYSRHKRGSSGAGGQWKMKAPIHKRIQKVNLHTYKGVKLCTKCLRLVKTAEKNPSEKTPVQVQATA